MSDPIFTAAAHTMSGVVRAAENISARGASYTAAERVAIAAAARRAGAGDQSATGDLPTAVSDMAARVATNASSITAELVDSFPSSESFVELVGVVSRTTAIDTLHRGLGWDPVALRALDSDSPTGELSSNAKRRSAFVPTTGPAGATSALSLVPAEDAAQADLHGALYLTYQEMSNYSIVKGLPRWQLEVIASRTSLHNHCFF